MAGNVVYSFIDLFLGSHQVRIAEEDKKNITFRIEWGSIYYDVMPFGWKNAPIVFSRIVIITFMNFIHKFFKV